MHSWTDLTPALWGVYDPQSSQNQQNPGKSEKKLSQCTSKFKFFCIKTVYRTSNVSEMYSWANLVCAKWGSKRPERSQNRHTRYMAPYKGANSRKAIFWCFYRRLKIVLDTIWAYKPLNTLPVCPRCTPEQIWPRHCELYMTHKALKINKIHTRKKTKSTLKNKSSSYLNHLLSVSQIASIFSIRV